MVAPSQPCQGRTLTGALWPPLCALALAQHPQREEYWGNVNCIGERSCYDEGKRAAECLTMDYHREHGLEVRGGAGPCCTALCRVGV